MGNQPSTSTTANATTNNTSNASWVRGFGGADEAASIEGRELKSTKSDISPTSTPDIDSTRSIPAPESELVTRTEILTGWLQKQTIQRTKAASFTATTTPITTTAIAVPTSNSNNSSLSSSPNIYSTSPTSPTSATPANASSSSFMNSFISTWKPKYNNSAWKNRYFVLSRGIIYYYSVKPEEIYKNVQKIEPKCASRIPIRLTGFNKIGYSFTIHWPGRGTQAPLQLATSTEQELNNWLQFFENYNISVPGSTEKGGWIYLFNNIYKKWHFRYLNVKSEILEFTQRDEKGVFPLAGSTVTIPDTLVNSSTGFLFTVFDSTKVLNLSAESEEVRSKWMEAINNEIGFLEKSNLTTTDRIAIELSNKVNDVMEQHQAAQLLKLKQLEDQEASAHPAPPKKEGEKLFILSIDGGGMRGIITTLILARIMEKFPDFLAKVDLVAGCSNGGMVAMAIAFDYEPKFCHLMLEMTGDTIFKGSSFSTPLNSAKFKNTHLKLLCDLVWSDKKLSDAKKKVMIPAFLLDNQSQDPKKRSCEPRIFHNFDDTEDDLASDVVMRTIAAPTFFPSYQQYTDGGIFCHDPASQALSLALSPKRLNKRPSEICLLSLGTGKVNRYHEDPNHDWGYYQWLPRLPNCFWDGMLGKSEMICREILGDAYFRLDPMMEKELPMDNPLIIPELTELGKNLDLTELFKWIDAQVYGNTPSEQ